MMNFASVKPGIDTFNANVARGDQQRSQEESDFQRRAQFEQAQGADRGVRNAISAFYANRAAATPAAPVPTTPFQPAPAPAPIVMPPAQPANMSVGPAGNQASWETTGGVRVPNAQDFGNAPAVSQPAVPAPATATAVSNAGPAASNAGPAVSNAQPAPSAQPTGRGDMAAMMGELAKSPGTSQSMMHLFSTDVTSQRAAAVEERKLKAEGNKEMLAHLKDGDARMAKAVADQYGIKIPDEVWSNRNLVMKMRLGAHLAKTMGVKDDHAVHFVQGFLESSAAGMPEDQAVIAGLKGIPKGGFEVKGTVTDDTNTVLGYDKGGNAQPLMNAGKPVKARDRKFDLYPPGSAGGAQGRPSATIQNRDDMAKRLVVAYPGLDEATVQRMVVNPKAQMTANDFIRVANNLRKATNMGRPVYKTEAEVQAAARQTIAAAQADAAAMLKQAGPEPAPGPAAAPAGRSGAARIRYDAQGNELPPAGDDGE